MGNIWTRGARWVLCSLALGLASSGGCGGGKDGERLGSVALPVSAIDRTVSTVLANATSFLYTEADPVQTGVAAGTIVPVTAAVIVGQVLDASGSPLPGVAVTIVNHTEFGSTTSRADGGFNMAVNGGQKLRIHYGLADYLPLERLVEVPWQDYAIVEAVVLLQVDTQVTEVDSSSSSTSMQVARGTTSTDGSGTRQATLLVPPGTQATMTLPNGSTMALDTIHVRATEYTVGTNGPNAMPADLPAASGYTYAVELTADEALAAGATQLTFSGPMPFYLENFLGIPVGQSVPSSFYDPARGAWVPSASGVILRILGVTAGKAEVDVNGDGTADTGGALDPFGITDLELQELAVLYAPDQTLWRIPRRISRRGARVGAAALLPAPPRMLVGKPLATMRMAVPSLARSECPPFLVTGILSRVLTKQRGATIPSTAKGTASRTG
jgi:hypothetical protein